MVSLCLKPVTPAEFRQSFHKEYKYEEKSM